MNEGPRITVAIPTMNGARHLPEALRGVLVQDGVAFDLLICDDRSSDDTLAIVRSVAGDRARVVVNSERLGLAGNWNQCVRASQTPLVAVVHQDDRLRRGHLGLHLKAFDADPAVGLVASGSGVIDDAGAEVSATVVDRGGLGPSDRTFAAGAALPLLAPGNPLRCSAVSIRAAAHADVEGFDPTFGYVVDWDFWIRVARRWSLAWIAETTVDVRWHPSSETHRFKTGTADLDETERVYESLRRELTPDGKAVGEIDRVMRRRLSRAFLNRAHVALRGGDGALARLCLRRAIRIAPGILGVIAADPRLAAQMASVWAAPETAGRWWKKSD